MDTKRRCMRNDDIDSWKILFMKTKDITLSQATQDPIRIYDNTFIFKKDDPSLRDLFDQEITEMIKNGAIEELIRKYTGKEDTFE